MHSYTHTYIHIIFLSFIFQNAKTRVIVSVIWYIHGSGWGESASGVAVWPADLLL